MTNLPYTEDDLRSQAAGRHATLTDDSDFMGVGEGMEDDIVASTESDGGRTWSELLPDHDDYNAAQRKIHDLVRNAADVSEWAINLGADGLEPQEHAITLGADEKPIARIHFAFEPGMPEEMRTALVEGIGEAIADHL
ncbi:hypothetical protein AB0K71_06030 [Streptomyces syringium]|uniref:hypothetical protein n=1 Tax=Streptomyces syringium TaxID=76729 RepID=UPI003415964B